jgi:hypothetical protein
VKNVVAVFEKKWGGEGACTSCKNVTNLALLVLLGNDTNNVRFVTFLQEVQALSSPHFFFEDGLNILHFQRKRGL